jgi:hypothetical protein
VAYQEEKKSFCCRYLTEYIPVRGRHDEFGKTEGKLEPTVFNVIHIMHD